MPSLDEMAKSLSEALTNKRTKQKAFETAQKSAETARQELDAAEVAVRKVTTDMKAEIVKAEQELTPEVPSNTTVV